MLGRLAGIGAAVLAACSGQAPVARTPSMPDAGPASAGSPPPPLALTVALMGAGAGRVVSTPAGIDCPGACSATFPAATAVSFAAAPDPRSFFAGWQDSCQGTGPCSVSESGTLSATFSPARLTGLQVVPVAAQMPGLRLNPDPMRVFIRQWVRLEAFKGPVSEPRVTWSVQEGPAAGAVSADGTYTAPAQPTVAHVVATSLDDPSMRGAIEVQAVIAQQLYDYGGPILPRPAIQLIWWGTQREFGGAVEVFHAFLAGVNGSAWLALLDQYLRGEKAAVTPLADVFDASPRPAGPIDPGPEICRALRSHALAPSPGAIYALLLPDSSGAFDYHAVATCYPGVQVRILVVGLPAAGGAYDGACGGRMSAPERMLWAFSHELSEAMTDPEPVSAWADVFGQEVADDCVRPACAALATGSFSLTALLSNAAGGCVP